MLSNLLDEKGQEKINIILSNLSFPIKCYCVLMVVILLLNSYYLYRITEYMKQINLARN